MGNACSTHGWTAYRHKTWIVQRGRKRRIWKHLVWAKAWLPWQLLLAGCMLPVRFAHLAEPFRNELWKKPCSNAWIYGGWSRYNRAVINGVFVWPYCSWLASVHAGICVIATELSACQGWLRSMQFVNIPLNHVSWIIQC